MKILLYISSIVDSDAWGDHHLDCKLDQVEKYYTHTLSLAYSRLRVHALEPQFSWLPCEFVEFSVLGSEGRDATGMGGPCHTTHFFKSHCYRCSVCEPRAAKPFVSLARSPA